MKATASPVVPAESLDRLLVGGLELLDHRGLEWPRVRRARHLLYERFHYAYGGPVRDLRQRLVAVPPDCHGDQRLLSYKVNAEPVPVGRRESVDRFGNRVLEFDVARMESWCEFEVIFAVERVAGEPGPPVRRAELELNRSPTRLTAADARLEAVARDLAAQFEGVALAEAIHRWASDAIVYAHGATGVNTTAAEALEAGRGLCQDFAHLYLAVARAAGLPARYVSGHLLGEGGSHAWVEALLPAPGGARALAFDPTNRRQPHLGYLTVAVGRDYADVPPTSGRYTGSPTSQLSFEKRAGLMSVELEGGEVREVGGHASGV